MSKRSGSNWSRCGPRQIAQLLSALRLLQPFRGGRGDPGDGSDHPGESRGRADQDGYRQPRGRALGSRRPAIERPSGLNCNRVAAHPVRDKCGRGGTDHRHGNCHVRRSPSLGGCERTVDATSCKTGDIQESNRLYFNGLPSVGPRFIRVGSDKDQDTPPDQS